MENTIKIDIISDVVCPWCIIGYKRLNKAVSELGIEDNVEVKWHPFQLNPEMGKDGEEVTGHMMKKYGLTPDDCRSTLEQLTTLGADVGFTFDFFDNFKMVNTGDLHILLDYAIKFGKQTELKLRLFNACFTERKNVSDRQVLAQELKSVGLNEKEGLAELDNIVFRNKVEADEAYWKKRGVSGVPTMIFNNVNTFTGAQPVSIYRQVLLSCMKGEETVQLQSVSL